MEQRIGRRRLLLGAGGMAAGLGLVALAGRPARADAAAVQAKIKEIVGDRELREGRVTLDAPEIAENGNTVPISVSVDSPMTPEDHVQRVHVFADGNPNPEVCTFHFTPKNGEAWASTRIRLAKTQKVYALAEMSDGSVYVTNREVKVTIGGCGG